jgi:glycine betaine catabolism B
MLMLKSVNFEQREFQIHQLERSHPEQAEWVIGRNTTCDLVLASPEISRIHGRIICIDSSYYFIDVGSSSGSVLNGETVPVDEPRQLQAGDLLQLGQTFLHIEALTPPTTIELAPAIESSTLLPTELWNKEDLFCRCCQIVDETPDVKTFYFVAEPPVQFCYQPGQFVNLEVTINGKTVIRPYSISSSPTRPYHLSVTVKRVPSPPNQPELPPGLVSNWLHDHLKVGNCIRIIGGAMGQFTCVPNVPKKLLLISAGSGITPMMSMLRWLQDTLTQCDITFLHSAASPEDIVFRKELEAIAAQMPNLRLAITITRSQQAWTGLTGRISRSMLSFVVPDLLDRSVYVCGSEDFMQSIRTLLDSMDFPMHNYQEESFGGQLTKTIAAPIEPQQHDLPTQIPAPVTSHNGKTLAPTQSDTASVVYFTESDQQALSDGSTPILELAEQEGVQIRHACRAGACGMCKVKVRKGQVRYQTAPNALTIADQQEGYVLSCIAYPVKLLEVEA